MSEIWKRMFFLLALLSLVGSIRGVGQEVYGHGVAIEAQQQVNRGCRVLGAPNGIGSYYILNGFQIIDLGCSLQLEDDISISVRGLLSAGNGTVELSEDGETFVTIGDLNQALTASIRSSCFESLDLTVPEGHFRFIRIQAINSYFYVDAISWTSRSGDVDGDGVPNASDCALMDPSLGNDSDGDGICDELDLDADNDGISNDAERECEVIPTRTADGVEDAFSISGEGPEAAIGSDNQRARLNNLGDRLILRFDEPVLAGVDIVIEARTTRSFHVLGCSVSSDGQNYTDVQPISWGLLSSDVEHVLSFPVSTAFIRFQLLEDNGRGNVSIDDVRAIGSTICQVLDHDSDGLENYLDLDSDLDSDGDGCSDVEESGFMDENEDGMLDGDGVDSDGMVTGYAEGYLPRDPAVVISGFGSCLPDGDIIYEAVNVSVDSEDENIGDGVGADIDGNCSLRAAIQEANALEGTAVISFDTEGEIILDAPLPFITGSVIIDGTSAPGYTQGEPSVALRTSGFEALQLSEARNCIIRGLDLSAVAVSGFDDYGIILSYAEDVVITENVIAHRERAIHANNSCGLEVSGNDLRGSGGASWDAALYLNNVCSTQLDNDLRVQDNLFGPL